jgi:hypothetical protein
MCSRADLHLAANPCSRQLLSERPVHLFKPDIGQADRKQLNNVAVSEQFATELMHLSLLWSSISLSFVCMISLQFMCMMKITVHVYDI